MVGNKYDITMGNSNTTLKIFLILIAAGVVLPQGAYAGIPSSGISTELFASATLAIAILLLIGLIGRGLAIRVGQPSVMGELLIGVMVGSIGHWLGFPLFILIMHNNEFMHLFQSLWSENVALSTLIEQWQTENIETEFTATVAKDLVGHPNAVFYVSALFVMWFISNIGVLLLLFVVGLRNSVTEMRRVGNQSIVVALLGVVLPFTLGFSYCRLFLPTLSLHGAMFVGSMLSATSIGISARIFKDLDQIDSLEAKIVLGAAVIDDVLGMVILSVIIGVISTGVFELGVIAQLLFSALAFLGVILIFGPYLVGRGVAFFRFFETHNLKLLYPLFLAFALAWFSSLFGLAPIIGAFAAGLILSDSQFKSEQEDGRIEQLVQPLETVFTPIFFVVMGMQVDLNVFLNLEVVWFALGLTFVAIFGKTLAGFGAGKNANRLTVGLGMVPRGEVLLIFASIGKGLGVVKEPVFSSIILIVIVTSLLSPMGLKWSMSRQ